MNYRAHEYWYFWNNSKYDGIRRYFGHIASIKWNERPQIELFVSVYNDEIIAFGVFSIFNCKMLFKWGSKPKFSTNILMKVFFPHRLYFRESSQRWWDHAAHRTIIQSGWFEYFPTYYNQHQRISVIHQRNNHQGRI